MNLDCETHAVGHSPSRGQVAYCTPKESIRRCEHKSADYTSSAGACAVSSHSLALKRTDPLKSHSLAQKGTNTRRATSHCFLNRDIVPIRLFAQPLEPPSRFLRMAERADVREGQCSNLIRRC